MPRFADISDSFANLRQSSTLLDGDLAWEPFNITDFKSVGHFDLPIFADDNVARIVFREVAVSLKIREKRVRTRTSERGRGRRKEAEQKKKKKKNKNNNKKKQKQKQKKEENNNNKKQKEEEGGEGRETSLGNFAFSSRNDVQLLLLVLFFHAEDKIRVRSTFSTESGESLFDFSS